MPLFLNTKDLYFIERRTPPADSLTAFRKYEGTILSSMAEVAFSLVGPASLCRAAGEDSNLMCFSSAAKTELQLMETFFSSLR